MDSKTIKSIKDIENLNAQNIYNKHKLDIAYLANQNKIEIIQKFLQTKNDHPNLKKKEICNMINVNETYLYRIMKDYDVPSPYRHKIKINKKSKTKVKDTKSTETSSTKKTSNKNEIRGGLIENFDSKKVFENLTSKP